MALLRTSLQYPQILIIGARPRIKPVTYSVATLLHYTVHILYTACLLVRFAVLHSPFHQDTHNPAPGHRRTGGLNTGQRRKTSLKLFESVGDLCISVRIRIRGSAPLTKGSGSGSNSGSDSYLQWIEGSKFFFLFSYLTYPQAPTLSLVLKI